MEESPIQVARVMRLFPTVAWRAESRPDALRWINEKIVAKGYNAKRGEGCDEH